MDPILVGLPILQCRQTEPFGGRGAYVRLDVERLADLPGLSTSIRPAVFPPLRPLGGVGWVDMILKVCPAFFLQVWLAFFRPVFVGGMHL